MEKRSSPNPEITIVLDGKQVKVPREKLVAKIKQYMENEKKAERVESLFISQSPIRLSLEGEKIQMLVDDALLVLSYKPVYEAIQKALPDLI